MLTQVREMHQVATDKARSRSTDKCCEYSGDSIILRSESGSGGMQYSECCNKQRSLLHRRGSYRSIIDYGPWVDC